MNGCKKVFKLSVDSWSVKQLQASISGVSLRSCTVGQEVIVPGQDTCTLSLTWIIQYDLLKTWLAMLKAAGQNCVHRRSICLVTNPC